MSIYLVSGKLGSGKTLACVGRMRDALVANRRVASNLDINLPMLLNPWSKQSVIRLPDKPTLADLEALGKGQDGIEEERNGLIVLDELAAWLNARSWADKERQAVIDWLLHSRKLGWDVMFIAQHLDMIDKQVRVALVEFHVICRRWDRLSIPLVTSLLGIRPPKIHMGIVKYGTDRESLVVDRWWYRAHDLYAAYDTRQVFRDNVSVRGVSTPHVGIHSLLPAWHTAGRYRGPRIDAREAPRIFFSLGYLVLASIFIRLGWLTTSQAFNAPRPLRNGGGVVVDVDQGGTFSPAGHFVP